MPTIALLNNKSVGNSIIQALYLWHYFNDRNNPTSLNRASGFIGNGKTGKEKHTESQNRKKKTKQKQTKQNKTKQTKNKKNRSTPKTACKTDETDTFSHHSYQNPNRSNTDDSWSKKRFQDYVRSMEAKIAAQIEEEPEPN